MAATHAASEHWRSQRAGAEASKSETTGDRVHALRLKQTSPADQAFLPLRRSAAHLGRELLPRSRHRPAPL